MHITKPHLCHSAVTESLWGIQQPDDRVIEAAVRLYRKACTRGKWNRFWASLRGEVKPLLNLNGYKEEQRVYGWRYVGIYDVPLDWITGSEKLCSSFDQSFFPLRGHNKAHWLTVASTQLMGNPAPPVDLIQISSTYFAQTGQYQISVARALGLKTIRAYVTRWHVYGQTDTHRLHGSFEHEPVWAVQHSARNAKIQSSEEAQKWTGGYA
jgi:hypothetical protein